MVNRMTLGLLFSGLVCLFLGLLGVLCDAQLPANTSIFVLFKQTDILEILLLQNYTLPRIAMALLAGGILGFTSLLLQQVMNNTLASDSTLGISSGAQFSLFLTAVFMPQWLETGAVWVASVGAFISLILVLCLAWRKTMSPLLVILAGLVVNLYLGSFSSIMLLFYPEESRGLAQWAAGSLVQESWYDTKWLAIQTAPLFLVVALLSRSLNLLSLNDANASSLGVPVTRLRFIGIVISAYLIAAVVSRVGMLGFIGLSAATIVRQLGVRTFRCQLIASFMTGALLLVVIDLSLQFLSLKRQMNLPTGAVTALLGTPLLLWLMFTTQSHIGRLTEMPALQVRKVRCSLLIFLVLLLATVIWFALSVGKGQFGWQFISPDYLNGELFKLRYPRVLTALSVGILLAVAGVLLQRLTLNPMASPELLGVSSGTSMGILAMLFLLNTQQPSAYWIAGIAGACIALFILTAINQRSGMLPEKVLLTGISLSALFDTFQRIAIASGSPRAQQLVSWTSGSTQNIDSELVLPFLGVTIFLLGISFIFSRWLELLSLQATVAQSLGLNLKKVRWILILFSALLTALATLIIGPLSFIGLLVPHLTRFLGITKSHHQILISAIFGGIIMVLADWLGRQIMFPYEVPAGLVATLLGGSYFLLTVRKV